MAKKKKTSSKPSRNADEVTVEILRTCQDLSTYLECLRRDVQNLHEKIEKTEAVNCRQRLEIMELEESNEELRKLLYARPFWKKALGLH